MSKRNQKKDLVLATMEKQPTKLWTAKSMASFLKLDPVEDKAIRNSLWRLWRDGLILSHIEKDDRQRQYAINIEPDCIKEYQKNQNMSKALTGKRKSTRKTVKSSGNNIKEIKSLSAQIMNDLLKLEAMVDAVIEEENQLQKQIDQINRVFQ